MKTDSIGKEPLRIRFDGSIKQRLKPHPRLFFSGARMNKGEEEVCLPN